MGYVIVGALSCRTRRVRIRVTLRPVVSTFLLPTYLPRPIRIIINLGPSYGLRSEREAHRTTFCGHISVAAATGAPRLMGDSKGKFAFDKEQLERRMWLG